MRGLTSKERGREGREGRGREEREGEGRGGKGRGWEGKERATSPHYLEEVYAYVDFLPLLILFSIADVSVVAFRGNFDFKR